MIFKNREVLDRICNNFGIELSDDEAKDISTPSQLADLISRKLSEVEVHACSQQRAFYLLRKCLVSEFGVPYDAVTLDSKIKNLLKGKDQKESWEKMKVCTRTTYWPRLKTPILMHYTVRIADVAIYMYLVMQSNSWGSYVAASFWALIPVLIFHTIIYKTTKQFRNRIDPQYKTVQKLLPIITTSKMFVWSQAEIDQEIKEILIKFGVVTEEKYDSEKSVA